MPKYINANHSFAPGLSDEVKTAKKESEIIIKYSVNENDDKLKDEALEEGNLFQNQKTLVINDYSLVGGGMFRAAWNFYSANQPVLRFATQKIADMAIGAMLKTGFNKFISLFKKSVTVTQQPVGIIIFGPNNSNLQFRLFSYFDDEDVSNALAAITQVLSENPFQDNLGKIFIFDTKKKKWFYPDDEVYHERYAMTMES